MAFRSAKNKASKNLTKEDKSVSAIQSQIDKEGAWRDFQESVIADIRQKYDDRKNQRQELELMWRLSLNFYNGDQFTNIDYTTNDVTEEDPFTAWEERNVFNEIASAIDTRLAILSKRKNNMKNRPASSSSEDRTAAKIGNKILASTKKRIRMQDKQQEANLISSIMGTAVLENDMGFH